MPRCNPTVSAELWRGTWFFCSRFSSCIFVFVLAMTFLISSKHFRRLLISFWGPSNIVSRQKFESPNSFSLRSTKISFAESVFPGSRFMVTTREGNRAHISRKRRRLKVSLRTELTISFKLDLFRKNSTFFLSRSKPLVARSKSTFAYFFEFDSQSSSQRHN